MDSLKLRALKNVGRRIKVITLVREPISRNFSAFFENIDVFTGNKTLPAEALADLFRSQYDHFYPHDWMTSELNWYFGVSYKQAPWLQYSKSQMLFCSWADILVLRCEDADDIKENAIRLFLGNPKFSITQSHNISSNKDYAELYGQTKQFLQLSEEFVSSMLQLPYVRKYYTDIEIDAIRKKWNKTGSQ